MLRWISALGVVIGLLAIGVGGVHWFAKTTADKAEIVRLARVQHQQLKQQLTLLQSPDIAPLILTLQEDLDTLQIKLVEAMTQQPSPAGILTVGYEQSLMPQALETDHGDRVRVLRLELKLTVRHARSLLEFLEKIDHSAGLWPHEIRACELQRLPEQTLSAQCVVDFYHWDDTGERAALLSAPSRLESVAWT